MQNVVNFFRNTHKIFCRPSRRSCGADKMEQSVANFEYSRVVLKKLLYVGSYIFFAILTEITTFLALGLGAFPLYFGLDLAVMLLFGALIFMIPNFKASAAAILFLLLAQCVVSGVNGTLYEMSGFVFTFSLLRLLGEAGDVFRLDMLDAWLIAALILYVSLEGVFLLKMRRYRATGCVKEQIALALLIVCSIVSIGCFGLFSATKYTFTTVDQDDPYYIFHDDEYLWDTLFIAGNAYSKFGTFGFYYRDIQNTIAPKSVEVEGDIFDHDSLWNSQLEPYGGSEDILTGKFEGQNLVLITMETGEWYGINAEYTPTLYALASQGIAMTNYYAKDKTNHSEALSILGSYPLAVEDITDIKDHTLPFTSANLFGADGYTTNYFHANDGYFYKRHDTHEQLYGFDYAHFLDEMERLNGYASYETKNFYDFDSDSEMISQYMDEFTRVDEGDSYFFTMLMSLTSHGDYEDLVEYGDYTADLTEAEKQSRSSKYTVKRLENYYLKIDDYPAASSLIDEKYAPSKTREEDESLFLRYKRYQAGLMDLDVGLNRLIHTLQKSGELDNTVFVVYADHNCYYNSQQYNMKGVDANEYWNTRLFNIPFFIWSGSCMDLSVENIYEGVAYVPDSTVESVYEGDFYYSIDHRCEGDPIGGVTIDKFCSSLDVLPTVLELFGYDFSLELYQGVSVFKEQETSFVSRESGQFNDDMYLTPTNNIYLMAYKDGSRIVSQDGEVIVDGEALYVLQNGAWAQYDLSETNGLVSTYSGSAEYIMMVNTQENTQFFSDSMNSFLLATVEYYNKQDILELMYESDYFATHSIDNFVIKMSSDTE